ncbi:hypothetical protein T06_12516 [Trichinella sp. T6]|nr:hypothetical protein T06_12516 [Trichinella sp. T6]
MGLGGEFGPGHGEKCLEKWTVMVLSTLTDPNILYAVLGGQMLTIRTFKLKVKVYL